MKQLVAVSALVIQSTACAKSLPPLPEYTTEEDVDGQLYMVNEIWGGEVTVLSTGEDRGRVFRVAGGRVIVGRIDPLPRATIAGRTCIGHDGRFTTAVADGRALTFYAHGYDQLHVKDSSRIRESVFDAGVVRFSKTPPGELRQWEVEVDAKGFDGQIRAALMIKNNDYLFQDGGHQCGASIVANVETKVVEPKNRVRFEGLSRIPYQVEFSGPGLVRHTIEIDRRAGGIIRAAPITLVPAPRLKFVFRARTRAKNGDWKEDEAIHTEAVTCDGKAELLFSEERDGWGNSLDLRLEPTSDGVLASFYHYGNNSFIELGKGTVTADLHWDHVDRTGGESEVILRPGHHYLFQTTELDRIDVELLFGVETLD